ncbi:MAG: PAS domain-containing sensor histidine kinase, partial [bacterium]|nr:PAS domain-containing sensor histidine kinase [bacterium]
EAAEKLLGKPKDQVAGKHIAENLSEHQIASFSKEISTGDQGDKVEEIVVHGQENTRKILRASSAIIEDTSGMTLGTVSVLSDVTKQKEIDQLKDKFVAHVSHELRSPLTLIKGAVLTVKEKIAGELNHDQEDLLNDAGEGIARLERLINDLLDISKIESGKMELKLAPADLNNLIQKVVDSSQLWAKNKKLELKAIPGNIPGTQVDQDKFTQIIMNLISNAIKFTPDQGHIVLETYHQPEENNIYVTIQDTGVGIAKDNLHKVFGKFQQFGVGRGGSGLGLFICKELVEMHGGTIIIDSDTGKGTKFTITIPVKPVSQSV